MNAQTRGQIQRTERNGDHQVIHPSNPLKSRAMVRASPYAVTEDPIQRAEQALASLSTQFDGWMRNELDMLEAAHFAFRTHGPAQDRLQRLFRAAHDIRGQSPTLGYPLVAAVAESLCMLLEYVPAAHIPPALVDRHVETIRAMIREDAKGSEHKLAVTLSGHLRQATERLRLMHTPAGDAPAPAPN